MLKYIFIQYINNQLSIYTGYKKKGHTKADNSSHPFEIHAFHSKNNHMKGIIHLSSLSNFHLFLFLIIHFSFIFILQA